MAKRSTQRNDGGISPEAADWLARRLDDAPLDLDLLATLPLDEVKEELAAMGASDASFAEALDRRLAGAGVGERPSLSPSSPVDRLPRSRMRLFSLKGAFYVSAALLAGVVLAPFVVKKVGQLRAPEKAIVDTAPAVPLDSIPATRLEGPAPGELVRGVRYVVVGLGRAALHTPLPHNPGALEATYRLRMTIDPQGHVVGLESLSAETDTFEPAVIDSLLRWRFEPGRDSRKTNTGTITIAYAPESISD
jgi:hypothetical protein